MLFVLTGGLLVGEPCPAEALLRAARLLPRISIVAHRARKLQLRAVMLDRLGPNVWHTSPSAAMATLEELEETARLWLLAYVETGRLRYFPAEPVEGANSNRRLVGESTPEVLREQDVEDED